MKSPSIPMTRLMIFCWGFFGLLQKEWTDIRWYGWLQHLHTDDRTALGLFEDAAQLSGLWGIRNSFPRPDWSYLLESKSRKDSMKCQNSWFFRGAILLDQKTFTENSNFVSHNCDYTCHNVTLYVANVSFVIAILNLIVWIYNSQCD